MFCTREVMAASHARSYYRTVLLLYPMCWTPSAVGEVAGNLESANHKPATGAEVAGSPP